MLYDDAIKDLGKLRNKYQFFLFFILVYRNQRNDLISFLFMEMKPSFACDWNVSLENANLSMHEITFSNMSQQICNLEWKNQSVKCSKWKYDSHSSIISEFNLVCEKSYIVNIIQGSLFVGLSFGFILGILSDRFGRKKVVIITNVVDIVCSTILIFSLNEWIFAIIRFFTGITLQLSIVTFSYCEELLNNESRNIAGNCWWFFWVFGYCILPLYAYLFPYWRHLQAVATALVYPTLLYPLFLPESPRWLLSKNRREEAQKEVNWLCRKNNIPLINIEDVKVEEIKILSIKQMLSNKYVIYRLLFTLYLWLVLNCLYAGLSLNITYSLDNPYLNVFVMGLSEAPSLPYGYFLSKFLGYRVTLYINIIITGVMILIIPFISGIVALRGILGIIAKVSVTTTYTILIIYCSELFPTEIRSTGLNIGSVTYFVGFLLPYINSLADIHFYFPALLFGVFGITSCIFIIPFPETLGNAIPEKIHEMPDLKWKIFKKIKKFKINSPSTLCENFEEKKLINNGSEDHHANQNV